MDIFDKISSNDRAFYSRFYWMKSKLSWCSLGSVSGGTLRSSGLETLKTDDILDTVPAERTSALSNVTCLPDS